MDGLTRPPGLQGRPPDPEQLQLGYVTDGTCRVFYPQAVETITAWAAGSPHPQTGLRFGKSPAAPKSSGDELLLERLHERQ